MSFVSGVVLIFSVVEELVEEGDSERYPILDSINAWLSAAGHSPLALVTAGGPKHPQIEVCAHGFNYFPEDDFAEAVIDQPWVAPGNVVLIINPEEGPARVFRPPNPSISREVPGLAEIIVAILDEHHR